VRLLQGCHRRCASLGVCLVVHDATRRFDVEVQAIKVEAADNLLECRLQFHYISAVGAEIIRPTFWCRLATD
jgi:hypothetical protein